MKTMQEKRYTNENFSGRLIDLIRSNPHKQKEISRITGISESALANYKKDRIPKSDELYKLASFFDVSMEWLLTGDQVLKEGGLVYNLKKPDRTRSVPLISWAHAGDATSYEELPKSWQEDVPTLCQDPHAFALRLEGDSMSPMYRAGSDLIVSPGSEVYSNIYVVVRFKDHQGVLFRRIEMVKDLVTLIPENERYPINQHKREEFEWIYPVYCVLDRLPSRNHAAEIKQK